MKFKNIIPFEGLDFIKLYSDINVVKEQLKKAEIEFVEEVWDNSRFKHKDNWHIITIDDSIKLFFSEGNNKLWKIYIYGNYDVQLPNGIKLGMNIDEALNIDKTLKYNDWEEDYETENGYWIEDNCETNAVISIVVFVREVDNRELIISLLYERISTKTN